MRFLGNILSTIIGIFMFFMILFFGVIFISAIFGGDGETVQVKKDSVIELDLSEVTADYGGKFTFKDIDYSDVKHDGLFDIIKAIKEAKTDDKIKGISILNDESSLGLAQIKALRNALEDFIKVF